MRFRILVALLSITAAACATTKTSQGDRSEASIREVTFASASATEQWVVVRPGTAGNASILCMVPFPDALTGRGSQMSVSAGLTNSEGVSHSSTREAIDLGGRSADVLLARELLYRACELAANVNADRELTLKIYDQFLTVLQSISQYQTEAGTAANTGVPPPATNDDDKK
jgi:hypothetical protein